MYIKYRLYTYIYRYITHTHTYIYREGMVVAEQGMVVADQAGMKKQYIYMYMQGCIHCLHLQQHSGMTWRGTQGVWLGVSVYREKHKMEYKRVCSGWIQVHRWSTRMSRQCCWELDMFAWLRNIHKQTKCVWGPTGAQHKKKWTIAAVNVVWHELWKISKPSVCGAMRMEDIWHLTLTSLTPPHQIQMRFKSKLSTRNIFHPQDLSK
jgi:hypothetical protein